MVKLEISSVSNNLLGHGKFKWVAISHSNKLALQHLLINQPSLFEYIANTHRKRLQRRSKRTQSQSDNFSIFNESSVARATPSDKQNQPKSWHIFTVMSFQMTSSCLDYVFYKEGVRRNLCERGNATSWPEMSHKFFIWSASGSVTEVTPKPECAQCYLNESWLARI